MGVCLVTSLAPAAGPPRRATAPEHGGTSRPLPAPGCRQPKKTMNFSLAGVPEKQGGLGSTLAAPQAVKAGLTQPESPQESHPEQREPESSHQGPRRACPPQQCPAPCFPPPHTSLSFLLLPVGCPIASRCRIISFFLSRSHTRKASASPFPATPPFCRIHTTFQLSPVVYRVEGSRLESELPIQALGMPTPPPPGLRSGWCNGL